MMYVRVLEDGEGGQKAVVRQKYGSPRGRGSIEDECRNFLILKGLCGHDFPGKSRLDQSLFCFTALVMR